MPAEWEQYKDRFTERPETYDSYVEVWKKNPSVRMHFSSWSLFTRCASAEPKLAREEPHRVRRAEELMRAGGFEIGGSTRRGARRWLRAKAAG